MKKSHCFEKYRSKLQPALQSKREEFILLGYTEVTDDYIWDFMTKKKWKKANEDALLHQLVNDVLSVKIGEYMHYATVEAFKEAQKNNVPDLDSFRDLFT
ncbi:MULTISPECIES: post-transcriptional regulator [Bacillus]|uniref:post-transcriptional regulator n=1 Tax=Bacillus TaxID=1386 RepID=UPI0002DDCC5C|nr:MULTISPECIES: post-transcriptional regulator [Bacillus]